MEIGNIYIGLTEQVAIGILLLLFLHQAYFYIRYIGAVGRQLRRQKKATATETTAEEADLPGVSGILCAHNEEENLISYLPALMMQDYPTYEIIVVDDRSEDNSRSVIEQYHLHDPRIKVTFVPNQARLTSTKKLGLTLAAKCAQYEYLLLTDADCRPESKGWIRAMMKGFVERQKSKDKRQKTEVVLGYGAYFENKSLLNRLIQYDTLFNGLHFLGCAIAHKPYMGVGRNLAYRKDLFFEAGGFSDSINLRSGDDDLFVNKVANRRNTAVSVGLEATTWSVPEKSWESWWEQKRRHLSVSPHYSFRSKWHLGFEAMTRGLFYLGFVLSWCVSLPVGLAATALLLLRWLIQAATIQPAAKRLGHRGFVLSIPFWDIVLPLLSLCLIIQRKTYTLNQW